MFACNPYDILSNKTQTQTETIEAKILIYLPPEFISTILSIFEIKSTSFLSITNVRYDETSKFLSFQGNKYDVELCENIITDLMEDTFAHYIINKFGNIGKWSDV